MRPARWSVGPYLRQLPVKFGALGRTRRLPIGLQLICVVRLLPAPYFSVYTIHPAGRVQARLGEVLRYRISTLYHHAITSAGGAVTGVINVVPLLSAIQHCCVQVILRATYPSTHRSSDLPRGAPQPYRSQPRTVRCRSLTRGRMPLVGIKRIWLLTVDAPLLVHVSSGPRALRCTTPIADGCAQRHKLIASLLRKSSVSTATAPKDSKRLAVSAES